MSKAKTTNTSQVQPWIPSGSEFKTFASRADGLVTPEMERALAGADASVRAAQVLPDYSPGFQDAVARGVDPSVRSEAFDQIRSNTMDTIMSGVNETFGSSGMTGSSLHQQHLARGLAEGIAGVENQAFQTGEDRALQAANLGQQGLQQQFAQKLTAADALAGLGTARQTAEQNALSTLMSSAVGASGQTSSQSTSPGLGGIIGTGLQIASLFSDERLKENGKKVGELDDGTPVHTYTYKPGAAPSPELEGVPMLGVMAQEVKKKGAVSQDEETGFFRVNYGAL